MSDPNSQNSDSLVTLSSSYETLPGSSGSSTYSILYMIAICCAIISFQTVYSILFALAYPMMDTLQISSAWRATIMLAGPLGGLIIQPLVGLYSDSCKSSWGRRRPFILVGSIGVCVGFAFLYYCVQIGQKISKAHAEAWGIFFFVLAILLAFFFINVLQGPARTIVGDLLPKEKQVLGNSIGSIMLGSAQVFNNFVGGFEVYKYLNFDSNYQFLIVFGGVIIIISTSITLIFAKEQPLQRPPSNQKNPFLTIFRAFRGMPSPIWRICWVLFFSWMGYFMFNVEVTDYSGHDLFPPDTDTVKKPNYNKGVAWGMIITGVSNVLVMIFGPFQDALIKHLGLRISYAISQIIEAACLIPLFFVHNKWASFALLAPLGISCSIFNTVPYAIVGANAEANEMGTYMGILNIFVVAGQQIVNWVIGSGFGSIYTKYKGHQIALGSIFALISAILCKWIIVPTPNEELKIDEKNDSLLPD